MENKPRCDNVLDVVLDTKELIVNIETTKLRTLLIELEMLVEDFQRDLAISCIAGNYCSKKHLTITILNGKTNDEIFEVIEQIKKDINDELESRKKR